MNKNKIKKVAILTSGGDSPGMNTAVGSIVKAANWKGIEPYFVYEGYKGLVEGNIKSAKNFDIDLYMNLGGTFIYSSRYPEFKEKKIQLEAKKQLDKKKIDALIVIGGDGSYNGAQALHNLGVKTICLPGTIDNDISSTDYTIGFFTALETITQSLDKIKDTSRSHNRCMIVEVMGRYAGDLAVCSGIAVGAELIITPEKKYSLNEVIDNVDYQMNVLKKQNMVIITTENIYDNLDEVAKKIENKTKISTRACVLGQTQRGGRPTSFERYVATLMGAKAIEILSEDKHGIAICYVKNELVYKPILEALSEHRKSFIKEIELFTKINQK